MKLSNSARSTLRTAVAVVLRPLGAAVAFAFPLAWLGITLSGGLPVLCLVAIASALAFEGGMRLGKGSLGIPADSCPIDARSWGVLLTQPWLNALAQLVVLWLLSVATIYAWWVLLLGSAVRVVVAMCFGLVERLLDAVIGD